MTPIDNIVNNQLIVKGNKKVTKTNEPDIDELFHIIE